MAEELIGNLSSSIVAVGDKFFLLTEPDARENDKQKEFANKFISSWISEQIRKLAFASDISEEECIGVWNKTYPDYQIRVRKWHTVEEFPNFEVSNDGLVRNIKTRNYITLSFRDEYYRVKVFDGQRNKNYYVNVLVATYFCIRPEGTNVVHHRNGKKTDNRAENLEWVTYGRNTDEWQKTRDYVNEIEQHENGKLIKVWKSVREASETLEYNGDCIRHCCNGLRKTYKGFVWNYKNERKKKISEEEIAEDYVEIGVIKGWDFSGNYIHRDGSRIIGKKGREMVSVLRDGYEIVELTDANGIGHSSLSVHKIINQVLKGGKYEAEMDHKDENKSNNDLDNLEEVTHEENVTRACGKAVKQIDVKTGDVIESFRCIRDAYKKLGKTGHIGDVCSGKREVAHGYKWEWVKDIDNPEVIIYKENDEIGSKRIDQVKEEYVKTDKDINKSRAVPHREEKIIAGGKSVRQINIETGDVIETFRCISDAERKFGKRIGGGDVSAVCNGKRKTAYGYKWEWVLKDDNKNTIISSSSHGKAVKQIDTSGNVIETFRCIADACKKLGKKRMDCISAVCNGRRKTTYGYKWEWAEEVSIEINQDGNKDTEVVRREKFIKVCGGKAVKQIDIDTGNVVEVFICLNDAYRKLGKKKTGSISDVCNGKRKTALGYKWVWIDE
jgi:HNH endonuclease/NUMOD1 domain